MYLIHWECFVAVKADCDYWSKRAFCKTYIHIGAGCASKICSEIGHTV